METNNKNKFIVVSYALYDVTKGDNGEEMLIERTTDERPFIFISGMGVTLPAFEEKVVDLAKGEEFDFQLDPEQAYGQHYDERVLELDKQIFPINGQFDAQHVQVGAIIPLQNEDGNHFNAVVKNISDTKVTCDLNHPLAGLKLNFCGQSLESREATAEEIAKMAQMISGERNTLNQRSCNNHRRTEVAHLLWLTSHSVHSLATNATDTNTCANSGQTCTYCGTQLCNLCC